MKKKPFYLKDMKIKMLGAALLVAAVGMTGCEDYYARQDAKPDGSTPFMTVTSPNKDFVYENNQDIAIQTVISDKDRLKEMSISVMEVNSGKEVFAYKPAANGKVVSVDTAFNASALPSGEYTFKLRAVDNRTNEGHQEFNFRIGAAN